jgi:hypothetical protein
MRDDTIRPAGDAGACSECGAHAPHADGGLLRCACGSLLARYVAGRIELKCRRCKRTVTIPLHSDLGDQSQP